MSFVRPIAAFILAFAPLAAQTITIQPTKAEKISETRTVALASGSALKVINVNGFIRVEAWDKAEVQFTGDFKPSSENEHVKVVLEPSNGKLEIRGEYPKHSGGGRYNGPQCEMTLKVPREVLPNLHNVNGEVALTGTSGAVTVDTINGSVKLDQVKGSLQLATVNGSIKGTNLDSRGKGVDAHSVNGSIHLRIDGLKGHLKASTVNGGISFKAKGAEQVEIKRQKVTATFPGGNENIVLGTVNGSITLE